MSINTEDAGDSPRLGQVVMVSAHGGPSAAIVVTGDEATALAELLIKEEASESDKESESPSAGAPSTWTRVKGYTPVEWAARNAQIVQFATLNLKASVFGAWKRAHRARAPDDDPKSLDATPPMARPSGRGPARSPSARRPSSSDERINARLIVAYKDALFDPMIKKAQWYAKNQSVYNAFVAWRKKMEALAEARAEEHAKSLARARKSKPGKTSARSRSPPSRAPSGARAAKTKLISTLGKCGLAEYAELLSEMGVNAEEDLGKATADEIIDAVGARLAPWQRRELVKYTLEETAPHTPTRPRAKSVARSPPASPASTRDYAYEEDGSSGLFRASKEKGLDGLTLAALVLEGVPHEERHGVAIFALQRLANLPQCAGFVDKLSLSTLTPDAALESLEVALESAAELGIVDPDHLRPDERGARAARTKILLMCVASARGTGSNKIGIKHSASEELIGGEDSTAFLQQQLISTIKNGSASASVGAGHRRLLKVAEQPALRRELKDLDEKASAGDLTLSEIQTSLRQHAEIAELLKHSNVSIPTGARPALIEVWEQGHRVGKHTVRLVAREIRPNLPQGADTQAIAEACFKGTVDTVDWRKVWSKNNSQGSILGEGKDSKSKEVQKEVDLSSVMPGVEQALRETNPGDNSIVATLTVVRASISRAQSEGGLTPAAAVNAILNPLLEDYSELYTEFNTGKPLPTLSEAWSHAKERPEVARLLSLSSGDGERFNNLNKKLASLEEENKKLADGLAKVNKRLDETQQLAAKRWRQHQADDDSSESGSSWGGGGGKGGGKGGSKGGGRNKGKPDAKADAKAEDKVAAPAP